MKPLECALASLENSNCFFLSPLCFSSCINPTNVRRKKKKKNKRARKPTLICIVENTKKKNEEKNVRTM